MTTSNINNCDLWKEYCYYLLELILTVYDPKTHEKEMILYRDNVKELIDKLYLANNIAGLKNARNELELQAKLFGKEFLLQVNKKLFEKFGFGISMEKEQKKALKIIERGSIKNDKEYYFIRDYFDVIASDQSIGQKEIRKITLLLDSYGVRKDL